MFLPTCSHFCRNCLRPSGGLIWDCVRAMCVGHDVSELIEATKTREWLSCLRGHSSTRFVIIIIIIMNHDDNFLFFIIFIFLFVIIFIFYHHLLHLNYHHYLFLPSSSSPSFSSLSSSSSHLTQSRPAIQRLS